MARARSEGLSVRSLIFRGVPALLALCVAGLSWNDSAEGWSPIAALNPDAASDSANESSVEIVEGNGAWIAVWSEGGDILHMRSIDDGVSWSAPALLNGAAASAGGVSVSTDGGGTWVVVWDSEYPLAGIGTDRDVLYVRSTDNGVTWSSPASLNTTADTDPSDHHEFEPEIVASGNGTWIATWILNQDAFDLDPGNDDVMVARSEDGGASWSDPVDVHPTGLAGYDHAQVSLATDGMGNWLLAWMSNEPLLGSEINVDYDILSITSSDDGVTWSTPGAVNSTADGGGPTDWSPDVSSDGQGTWLLVWYSAESLGGSIGLDDDILVTSSTDNGATWTQAAALNTNADTDGGNDTGPSIQSRGNGSWIATWTSMDDLSGTIGTDRDLLLSTSDDNGATWSAPYPVMPGADSDTADDRDPVLTFDAAGDHILAWGSTNDLGGTIGSDWDILYVRSADADGDFHEGLSDNCPTVFNPSQENAVHPSTIPGDRCEDPDEDGIVDFYDNCPDVANPGQENNVHPATSEGDHCEDPDADGIVDLNDNCPDAPNPGQENSIHPLTPEGDHCEDPDADGVVDFFDNCPDTPNSVQSDADGDSNGDACDTDDTDGDALTDNVEFFCGGDASSGSLRPERIDGDFAGVDDDGDTQIDEALPAGAEDFDCDGDGYIGAAEAGTPLCAGAANEDGIAAVGDDSLVNDGCPQVGATAESGAECENAIDDDGDTAVNDGCPQVGTYSEAQFNIGTTDQDPCGGLYTVGGDGWPSEFVTGGLTSSTNRVTVTDLTSFLAPARRLDTSPGHPNFDSRWDLSPGPGPFTNWIVINDLTALIAGSSGHPPMLGGNRAFAGPECPWPE